MPKEQGKGVSTRVSDLTIPASASSICTYSHPRTCPASDLQNPVCVFERKNERPTFESMWRDTIPLLLGISYEIQKDTLPHKQQKCSLFCLYGHLFSDYWLFTCYNKG